MEGIQNRLALGLICLLLLGGCRKTEKILPAQDGKWLYETWEEKRFEDGVEVRDSFQTEGLGGIEFLSDGTGYRLDETGARTLSFGWAVRDNDVLIRTGSNGIPVESVILDNQRKGQLWATNYETILDLGNGPVTIRTETVERLRRAD